MTIEQELEQVKSELAAKQIAAQSLKKSIDHYKELMKQWEEEYKGLVGSGWGHSCGEIGHLKAKVANLELKVVHSKKPKVVWIKEPCYKDRDYIVHKVTAKRIYVCLPGYDRHDLYNKDGTSVSTWGGASKIDIEATFGGPCPEKMK